MNKLLLLERYRSSLIALQRRSPLTAETYRLEIRRYLEWLEMKNLSLSPSTAISTSDSSTSSSTSIEEKAVGISDLTRYLAQRRKDDGLDSRSIAKAISALRSFYRFLEDDGDHGCAGFVSLLQIPHRFDRLPEVHHKEDVDRLLSLINIETPLGLRNRALFELVYSAGLRISEAVSLNIADIFFSKNLARVTGKGSKERLVIFGPEAESWLKRYLAGGRQKLLGHRTGKALFVSRTGKRLSRKGIWKNYSRLAIQAGLSTKLHTLRHTFATELLSGGADLRSVQELLGHAEITTTQIYTHIDPAHLRDSHQKYLPKLKSWSEA